MAAAGSTSLGNLVAWLLGMWQLRRHAARHGTAAPSAATGALMFGKLALAAVGAWAVRVHEVSASRDAVHVAAAWTSGRAPEGVTADGDYPVGGGNKPMSEDPGRPGERAGGAR